MIPIAEFMISQGLHDPAVGDLTTTTLSDHATEFPSQLLELPDLPFDGREMPVRDKICLATIPVGVVCQVKQGPDVRYVESETSRVADEGQPV